MSQVRHERDTPSTDGARPPEKGDFRERVPPLPAPKPPSGFRMPAEWEPHAATWIAWPHNQDDWPGKFAPIPWVYVEIVRPLHQSEKVCILVPDLSMKKQIRRLLFHAGVDFEQVSFFHFPTDR